VKRFSDDPRTELTIRGLLLGGLITLVFTAANVYLGLKVGLTFASSIPAAVISMAVLRFVRGSTIFENNIVQTVASAAGTLSSIIFVLPGLVMVGYWTGFPFWQTFGICAIGGILGVMYSVPLRRAMVVDSDLPYPEGVAAAEILRVGAGSQGEGAAVAQASENRAGLWTVIVGSVVSGAFYLITNTNIFAASIAKYIRVGASSTGLGFQFSLALVGVGHLVGLSVGAAMLVGIVLSWGVGVPVFSALHPLAGDAATVAGIVWHKQVRFIGAGTIGIAAIWALLRLARPLWSGVTSSLAASRLRASDPAAVIPRTEQDIPFGTVVTISVALLIPLAVLLYSFIAGSAVGALAVPLIIGAIVYVVIAGFLVAAACGYMAGLIGSSNSPVSGLGILAVLGAAGLLLIVARSAGTAATPTLIAFALFVTAVVLCVATIANDNLQDLKTGQLVDATPWKQQVGLIVGVIFGAAVIPPILTLLDRAYGFAGAPPHGDAVMQAHTTAHALAAPQATLISALARGVLNGDIAWNLIGIGVLVGVAVIVVDELLGVSRRLRLPPLAVGLGIYLPPDAILPIVLGAILGDLYERWGRTRPYAEPLQRLGVLLASGYIVGESLCGVLLAGMIVATKKDAPLALVGDAFAPLANWLATIAFIIIVGGLYWRMTRTAERIGETV
jgi:putative OPT family oligopeptide transporter